jgi:hypothetical protein
MDCLRRAKGFRGGVHRACMQMFRFPGQKGDTSWQLHQEDPYIGSNLQPSSNSNNKLLSGEIPLCWKEVGCGVVRGTRSQVFPMSELCTFTGTGNEEHAEGYVRASQRGEGSVRVNRRAFKQVRLCQRGCRV